MLGKLLKKLRGQSSDEPVYIVSGLPRSGTSLMMKMLEAGGLSVLTDEIRTADEDNPKGFYEFERVKKLKSGDTAWLDEARGKVVKVIGALVPNLPPTHPYRIIFLLRAMSEILASQKKMLIRRGEDPEKVDDAAIAALFQKHLAQTEAFMNSGKNIEWIPVSYNALVNDPKPQIERVSAFFGGTLDKSAMASVIDGQLYRNRAKS